MKIGVPKETVERERRVALVPEVVRKLVGQEHTIVVERGAGAGALLPDSLYEEAGAQMTADPAEVYGCDVVVKVAPPTPEEIGRLKSDGVLIGFLQPLTNGDGIRAIAGSGIDGLRDGGDPADQPRAGDGRPVLAGEHRRATRRC